nr:50S ribosomal protein L11 methyltransferase [Lachnospiraceae bacterium]
MKWTKLTIKTLAEAEDIIISTMYDLGLEGAQIEDKVPLTAWEKEQMFVDILPDAPENDGVAYVSFFVEIPEEGEENVAGAKEISAGLSDGVDNSYFAVSTGQKVDIAALVEDIKRELEDLRMFMDIGEGTVEVSETEDIDWMNNWKQYFHQFYIDDLLVTPSWEEVKEEDKDKKVLHIDPGTAFGTGMHETTQLCIRQLKKFITPETQLLDVGTGSGILAIVSLMYGIRSAVGTDLDPCAEPAVAENMEMNGISSDKFEMMIGNIISDKSVQDRVGYEKYDIVVANILAEVLVPLTPVIVNQLKPGGIYITSGIINGKEGLVQRAAEDAGMEIVEVTQQGEWMSVTARKLA